MSELPVLSAISARSAPPCCGFMMRHGQCDVFSCVSFVAIDLKPHSNRPDLIHPFASVIDSPPFESPETMVRVGPLSPFILSEGKALSHEHSQVCIKLDSKPDYVRLPEGDKKTYQNYGPDSLEAWHKAHGLYKP